jgi:histidine ammonia-lyase
VTIEVYCAVRALDLRLRQMPKARMGKGVEAAYDKVREVVPYRAGDAWWAPEIERLKELLAQSKFVDLFEGF